MRALAIALVVAAGWGPVWAAETVTEAQISFVEGPGPVPMLLSLRSGAAQVVESYVPEHAVGVYRVEVAPGDPIFAALAKLPAKAQGPAPVPDAPVVSITIHTAAGPRTLVAARPVVDPKVNAILSEVDRLIKLAHTKPVGTVMLTVLPPKAARSATLHLETVGRPGVDISVTDGTPRVESTPLPATPPDPNVTPLPAEWTAVTGKQAKPLALRLKAGQRRDVTVPITAPKPPFALRALFAGKLVVKEKGQPDMAGPVELSSPPVEVRK